jgi:hypothetical protein
MDDNRIPWRVSIIKNTNNEITDMKKKSSEERHKNGGCFGGCDR